MSASDERYIGPPPEPKPVELVVTKSETSDDLVSVRCWCPVRKRLSATRFREALTAAGYRPGDRVELRLKKGGA